MDNWIKTADRLPTREDGDAASKVEVTNCYGNRHAVQFRYVRDSPNLYPYWMPRNHLKPYEPPKRWSVQEGERVVYLNCESWHVEVFSALIYGSMENARAIAQAAANKANEVAP